MFVMLGIVVAIYTAYAALAGEVVIAQGPGARRVRRIESPVYFWICIAIYAGLSLAMIAIF